MVAVQLRAVVQIKTGTRNPTTKPDEKFTYIDVAGVDNLAKAIVSPKVLLGVDAPSRARKLIRTGDVLVSTIRPNLNAVAIVPEALDGQVASTGFCVLRPTDRVLPQYLYYFVRSPGFVSSLCGLVVGAMYPAVTDGQVLDQLIPLPSVAEQRLIVDILSRAESIVRLRREAQQKAAELVPAIFHQMFGDPARNPKKWPVQILGELLISGPTNGLYKHKSAYGSGVPILRIDAFYDGVVRDISALKRVMVDESELRRFGLAQNDIIINRVNSPEYLGKSAVVPPLAEPTVFESNMMRLTVNPNLLSPGYTIALLQTKFARDHFLANAKHAINQSSINQQDVKALQVMLPPLKEQGRFESKVATAKLIESQQSSSRVMAGATFNALLSSYFSEVV